MKSYLTDRLQCVLVNGCHSDFLQVSSGVPQGSVLGLVLFSAFINDLPGVLRYCVVHLFADDVQLYKSVGQDFLREDLKKISAVLVGSR